MLEMIAGAFLGCLGALFGYYLRTPEIAFLKGAYERQHQLLRHELETFKEILDSSQEYRERLLRELLALRREGYTPPPSEEGLESWVLSDAHEAEVSETRRNGGVSSAAREEFRGAIHEGITGQPLRD